MCLVIQNGSMLWLEEAIIKKAFRKCSKQQIERKSIVEAHRQHYHGKKRRDTTHNYIISCKVFRPHSVAHLLSKIRAGTARKMGGEVDRKFHANRYLTLRQRSRQR